MAKNFRIHRVRVRPATKEELGQGEVGAAFEATLTQSYYTKAVTDAAVSGALSAYDASVTGRLGAKANASTVQAIDNRVAATETGLSAQSTALTQVTARTNRGTGSGQLRVFAGSGPSGITARVGLTCEVDDSAAERAAALWLEALSGGGSSVTIRADRLAIVNGDNNGGRIVPFMVAGGVVYMDTAMIRDLTVDTIKIRDGAISRRWALSCAGPGTHNLTVNASAPASWFLITAIGAASRGGPNSGQTPSNPVKWAIRFNNGTVYERALPVFSRQTGSTANDVSYYCDEVVAGSALVTPATAGNHTATFYCGSAGAEVDVTLSILELKK